MSHGPGRSPRMPFTARQHAEGAERALRKTEQLISDAKGILNATQEREMALAVQFIQAAALTALALAATEPDGEVFS